MKITFNISDELARTLRAACHQTIGSEFQLITPDDFARECLESELASRRLSLMPQNDRVKFMAGEKAPNRDFSR